MNRHNSEDLGNVIAGDFIILLSQNKYQLHTFFTPIITCHIPHILLSHKLPMPQRSSNSNPPVTWAKNADAHPGVPDLVRKRKCHTKAEIKANNKAASEVKAAEEAKRLDGLKKIANLEMMINEDSNNIIPKPKKQLCPLQQTNSYVFLPLHNDRNHNLSEPLTELSALDGTKDKYQPEPVDQYECTDTDVEGKGELAQPKKKKVKVQVREVIKAASREIGQLMKNHEAGHETETQAVRLVFPFLSISLSMLTLDQSTPFYFSLNSHPEPLKKAMKSWAFNVDVVQSAFMKSNTGWRPGSRAGSSKTVSEYTLINNPITVSRKVNTNLKPRPICSILPTGLTSGGFQDEDELFGPEHDAAISSPIKGSGHLTSTVSHYH